MKAKIYYLLHKIWIVFAILCVLLAILLSLGRAITPLMQKNQHLLQIWASELVNQPLKIGSVSASWYYFQPMIHFSNVTVYNDNKTHILMNVNDLAVTVNLWQSFLKGRFQLGKMLVSGSHLILREDSKGQMMVNDMGAVALGASPEAARSPITELFEWLFFSADIGLSKIDIDWYRPDGRLIKINKVALSILNRPNKHIITGLAKMEYINSTSMRFALEILGDWHDTKKFKIKVYIDTDTLAIGDWLQGLGDLDTLFASSLLPPNIQETLVRLHPEGKLSQLHIHSSAENPDTFVIEGSFKDLSWRRWENIPGASGLSGFIRVIGKHGRLVINSKQSVLDFGTIFRKPIFLNVFKADVHWKGNDQGEFIQVSKLQLSNNDITNQGEFSVYIPSDQSGAVLNLLSGFTITNVREKTRYLPVTIIPKDVITWLDRAIIGGKEVNGTFIFRGRIADFPFEHGTGVFTVDAVARGMKIDYQAHWPPIEDMDADIIFNNSRMDIESHHGKIMEIPYDHVHADIPNLGKKPILEVESELSTDLSKALRFVRSSPLEKTLGDELSNIEMQGPMSLELKFALPFFDAKTTVDGFIRIPKAELQIPRWDIEVNNIKGDVQFTEDSITVNNMKAELFDEPIRINIGNLPNTKITDFSVKGRVSIDELDSQWPAWDLPKHFSGKGAYQVNLQVPPKESGQPSHLKLRSNLKGIGIEAIPPLSKPKHTVRNLTVDATIHKNTMSHVIVHYDPRMVVDASIVPWSANAWFARITSPEIVGTVLLPGKETLPVRANFSKLFLDFKNYKSESELKPSDIPSIIFHCDNCRFNDKSLGKIDIALTKIGNNRVNISNISSCMGSTTLQARGQWFSSEYGQVTYLSGQLKSNSVVQFLKNWDLPAAIDAKNAQLNFNLMWPSSPTDLTISQIKGNLSLELGRGKILDVGPAAQEKVGIGRLLTILSLESLPKRLTLDFSDLTEQGFGFDFLRGDFSLNRGILCTKNTLLDGTVAKIQIQGNVNLLQKIYDAKLTVTPHLTASLPVLAALVGGPITGGITWIADKLIGSQLQKIVSHDYKVTGPWSKPKIDEIK